MNHAHNAANESAIVQVSQRGAPLDCDFTGEFGSEIGGLNINKLGA